METNKKRQQQQLSVSKIDSRAFTFIAPGELSTICQGWSITFELDDLDIFMLVHFNTI